MKKAVLLVLACMLTFSFYQPETVVEAKTASQLQKEKEKLEKDKKAAEQALKDVKSKQKTVAEEIGALDKTVSEAQAALDKVETKLNDTTAKLEQSEKDLEAATQAKESQMEAFKKRVKYIHENGSMGYLKVILESQSFNDLMLRMQYVNDIMNYDKTTLDELKKNEEIIDTKTKDIASEKAEIEVLVADQKEKTTALESKLTEKKNLMASYEKDEAKYAQIIEENEKGSQEVTRLIAEANRAAAAAKSSSGSSSSGGSTFVYTGGQLNWPVPARAPSSASLSSGYVGRKRPIGSGSEFHTGYDIPAPYGSNIVAAEAGTVITAGWVRGYGNTVIINHGGGLSTLYGHNSKLVVSKGDVVSRGQVIAKCGSTGNSTGNHCHFEVRVNGAHTSPQPYLGVPNISR